MRASVALVAVGFVTFAAWAAAAATPAAPANPTAWPEMRDPFHDSLVARPATRSASFSDPASPAIATTVVHLRVSRVSLPAGLPGACRVEGVVQDVWEGRGFSEGQSMTIPVPCGHQAGLAPARSEIAAPLDVEVLAKAREGVARVDDQGRLAWQDGRNYVLPARALRVAPGRNVTVWGYRVLDGVVLPVSPKGLSL